MPAYMIGIDEAGYGPNLGPLLVAGTLWKVTPETQANELLLEQRLASYVRPSPSRGDASWMAIADSKQLYQSGDSLGELERGVLACLAQTDAGRSVSVDRWKTLWQLVCGDAANPLDSIPWYQGFDRELPQDVAPHLVSSTIERLKETLNSADVALREVAARPVFPGEFNQLIDDCGNKASALSKVSLELVQKLIPDDYDTLLVHCDKHGGRKKYGPLLQSVFPEDLVVVRKETAEESVYAWGPSHRRGTVRFVAKGDRFLPAALASMFAKYLRELAMLAFNEFWLQRVPGVRPTAGYPQDAKRFRNDIQESLRALGVDEAVFWRSR